jgi:hypothetical protein
VPEDVGPKRLGDGKVYCADCAYAWHEGEVARLRAENEALKAEALDVCSDTYRMLTAGIVDDHDRIMRACNELAEFGRRLTGDAEALSRRDSRGASDETDLTKEADHG